jgi:hypothetical protein
MMVLVSGENLGKKSRSAEPVGITINGQPLGRIVAGYQRKTLSILFMQWVACAPFIAHSGEGFKSTYILSPCGSLSKER